MAESDWRWLCTQCWTEGPGPRPDACPSCGCPDAWFQTASRPGVPMKQVYEDLFDQMLVPPKGVTKQ